MINREERRAEQKLQKRRLCWMERKRKRNKAMNKFVAELEENFDDDEIKAAKVFSVDFLTNSGFFAELEKTIDIGDVESINKIVRNYGLEPADGMFIMDTMEDIFSIFSAEKGEGNRRGKPKLNHNKVDRIEEANTEREKTQ